jgi:hypothetical protein
MSRSLLAALVAALVAIVPAAARAQDGPTLTFDKRCYAPGDTMTFTGSGYTPSGPVTMFLTSLSTQRTGAFDTAADAAGAIAGQVAAPEPGSYIDDDDWSSKMGATANDKTRLDAGEPPQSAVGATVLTLSRFEVQLDQPNGRPPRAAKRMDVTAAGFTGARGKTLYAHYRRGRKTLKTLKLGRLHGDCGDLDRRLARGLPRGLPKGRYQLVFNTARRDPQASPRFSLKQRFR